MRSNKLKNRDAVLIARLKTLEAAHMCTINIFDILDYLCKYRNSSI